MDQRENPPTPAEPHSSEQDYGRWLEMQRSWVQGYLKRKTRTSSDCDDLVQDVLQRAWEYRNTWRGDGDRSHWLLRIVANLLNNYYARRLPKEDMLEYREDFGPDFLEGVQRETGSACPYDSVENQLYIERLLKAVRKACTPPQQQVMLLIFQGKPYERIETLLQMEPGAARLHFFRGREVLMAYLAEQEPDMLGGRERLQAEWDKRCRALNLAERPTEEERRAWSNPGKYRKAYRSLVLQLIKNLPLPILLLLLYLMRSGAVR
jgi:RNA polymerase sigma factor (sigma-70 family)